MKGQDAAKERSAITGRAAVVALGTLTSRLLGLLRDMVLAASFQRSATDAWLIAWQIPNVLRQILAEGAVQTSVLPTLSGLKEKGDQEAARFYRAFSGLMLSVLILVSALGTFFAPQLVQLFASGFAERPGQLERTVELTRWVFPYIFFMGLSALGLAALNTHRRFVVSSFAPALLNVSFLLCCAALPGYFAERGIQRIFAMVCGGLLGGLLQVLAQLPSLRAIGYLKWPSFDWGHPGVRTALSRLAPSLLGIGVYFIDVVVGRRMLSSLGEGAVTYFSYGLRLCDFSQGIFVMALSSATLPSLASFAAQGRKDELSETLGYSLRLSLFVGVAATAFSVVLAEPLVATVFERGAFDAQDTSETVVALRAQGWGIFLVAGVRQLVIAFFALGKTLVPVMVAVVDLAVFYAVGSLLSAHYGHVGVSWAVTAARVCQFLLLWVALLRFVPHWSESKLLVGLAKTCASAVSASAGCGVVLWLLKQSTLSLLQQPVVQLLAAGFSFMLTFLACASLVRSEELKALVAPLLRRLGR